MIELLYRDLTEKIIKALFEVFEQLGPGLSEVIYKRALQEEFTGMGLKSKAEKSASVYYKNKKIGERRLDLVVEEKVVLELKSKFTLEPLDEAQILTYLKSTGYRVGILVNFGAKKLKFKRFIV